MINKELKDGTKDEQGTNVDVSSSSPHCTKLDVGSSFSSSEFQGLSIIKANGQYTHSLSNGEMSEPYEQFLIYLKPRQKVLFVEENKTKYFMVDTDFLNTIHSNVHP